MLLHYSNIEKEIFFLGISQNYRNIELFYMVNFNNCPFDFLGDILLGVVKCPHLMCCLLNEYGIHLFHIHPGCDRDL